jgi:hypothetical protein
MAAILSRAQRLQNAQAPITAPVSIPSPGGGWNTRDSLDGMDPLDAVTLDNWFPDAGGGMNVRGGFVRFAGGMGAGPVETLAEFNSGAHPATEVSDLVAACGGSVFEIGDSTPNLLGTGFSNARWQTAGFLNRTFFVNGADPAKIYDGTTFVDASFTGVDTSTLYGVWLHQQRLFFWTQRSSGFWFAPLNSISGALSFYDLGPFCPRGGFLVAMRSLSYDGGTGVINYASFVMSSGDCLLFQGNDPALITAWSLVGTYRLSPPVSTRAVADYGGDSFVTTFDDHLSFNAMFNALRNGQMPPRSKVSKAVQIAVAANQTAFGWQAIFYPRGRALIFNIPNSDGTFDQHVCNTGLQTQPWCRYKGMNASCWGLFNDRLYFGGPNGTVYQADTGNQDAGAPVQAMAQQAWNKLGTAQRKRLAAVRPVLQAISSVSYNFRVGFDYVDPNIPIPVVSSATGSPWDTSPWDTSAWSTEVNIDPRWRVGGGSGTALGWGISIAARESVQWLRTDLRLEGGNAL